MLFLPDSQPYTRATIRLNNYYFLTRDQLIPNYLSLYGWEPWRLLACLVARRVVDFFRCPTCRAPSYSLLQLLAGPLAGPLMYFLCQRHCSLDRSFIYLASRVARGVALSFRYTAQRTTQVFPLPDELLAVSLISSPCLRGQRTGNLDKKCAAIV